MVTTREEHRRLQWARDNLGATCRLIRGLVEIESPSESADAVNRAADFLAASAAGIARPAWQPGRNYGRVLRLDFDNAANGATGRILALGHLDTVWPVGTLQRMPYRETDGRLWGPGVLDMKAGLAMFVTAMRMLQEFGEPLRKHVSLLVVADEEVGSPESRPVTEAEAKASDVVLVLEPGTGLSGKLKTARKGIANYRISIAGKAAHAGVDFADGASAVLEAAHLIERLAAMTDLSRGITVNPGIVRGGTRSNVVAAEAEIWVDARAFRHDELAAIDRQMRALRPRDGGCTIRVEGGINRPPMERTPAIAGLFQTAQAAAGELRLEVEESATGGGSDGNFTAALGVPTLDGLGAVGEGAHAEHESVLVEHIAPRAALLASLVAKLAA